MLPIGSMDSERNTTNNCGLSVRADTQRAHYHDCVHKSRSVSPSVRVSPPSSSGALVFFSLVHRWQRRLVLSGNDRAIQCKMLDLSGRKDADANDYPPMTTPGNILSEQDLDVMELSFGACIRLAPKLLFWSWMTSITHVLSPRLANSLAFCSRVLLSPPHSEPPSECFKIVLLDQRRVCCGLGGH